MRILMCHDGSEQTDKALRFGVTIAKICQAEVTLLGITEAGGTDPGVLLARLQGIRESLDHAELRTELISKSGLPLTQILRHGDEENYDLVIIGAGSPATAMPATTYQLARRLRPSVLLVVGERTALEKILLCTSGNEQAERAIAASGALLQAAQASITLIHVFPAPPLIYANLIAREEDTTNLLTSESDLGRNVRRQMDMLKALGVKAELQLRHGLVPDEVIKEVRQGDYDLVVVGSSIDRGPIYRYMLDDVVREIVNRAPCPVLIARPPDNGHRERRSGSLRRAFAGMLDKFARFGKKNSQKSFD